MGSWRLRHNALHLGLLFRLIFVLFQQIAESFFDEFIEWAFEINCKFFRFLLQIVIQISINM